MEEFKVRLREKDSDKPWRYALTISQNGQVLSSTYDVERAVTFNARIADNVAFLANDPLGIYKKTDIEVF